MSITPAPELSPDADGIVGGGMDWYADTLPNAKWRFCDGALLSRAEFSLLYSRIGTTFSVGDGSTTFGLPNRAGKVAVGFDNSDVDFDTIGETGGSKGALLAHTHDDGSLAVDSHTHAYDDATATSTNTAAISGGFNALIDQTLIGRTSGAAAPGVTGTTGSAGSGTNSMNPYVVIRPIIKVM